MPVSPRTFEKSCSAYFFTSAIVSPPGREAAVASSSVRAGHTGGGQGDQVTKRDFPSPGRVRSRGPSTTRRLRRRYAQGGRTVVDVADRPRPDPVLSSPACDAPSSSPPPLRSAPLVSWRSCGSPSPIRPPSARRTLAPPPRSEEHTSELQSPYDLVCSLLLEKKKKKYIDTTTYEKKDKGSR